uniref:Uncharacterized protein n=1 Tax=Setaria digitata TaxID=48799 RepID=A0A915PLR6_9BILA
MNVKSECENMLNSSRQMDSSIIRYSPAPTAPIIESCDDSSYSVNMIRNPPPYSPPLPPQSEYAEPFLTRTSGKENETVQQLRRYDSDGIFKVALFEGLIAGAVISKYEFF